MQLHQSIKLWTTPLHCWLSRKVNINVPIQFPHFPFLFLFIHASLFNKLKLILTYANFLLLCISPLAYPFPSTNATMNNDYDTQQQQALPVFGCVCHLIICLTLNLPILSAFNMFYLYVTRRLVDPLAILPPKDPSFVPKMTHILELESIVSFSFPPSFLYTCLSSR